MGKECPVLFSLIALIGRICISLMFIIAGIVHIMHYQEMTAMMAKTSLANMHWLFIVAIVLELLGGILVFLGWFTRFGAVLLIIFSIIAAFSMHAFMQSVGAQHPVAAEAVAPAYHYFTFLRHLSIFGGLLYVLAFGAGRFGFDCYRKRASGCPM